MKQIREWLEKGGQDYATGVALYEAHGRSAVVLNTLRRGATDFTRQKLRQVLEKLVETKSAAAQAPVHVVDTPAKRVEKVPERVAIAPAAEDELRRQRGDWFAARTYAHAQLELVGTEAGRYELAAHILETSEKIAASYRPAESLAAPDPSPAVPLDAGEQRRRLANLRSQASKLKKNPARAGDLVRVQAQITQLETKLKDRDGDQPKLHPRH